MFLLPVNIEHRNFPSRKNEAVREEYYLVVSAPTKLLAFLTIVVGVGRKLVRTTAHVVDGGRRYIACMYIHGSRVAAPPPPPR